MQGSSSRGRSSRHPIAGVTPRRAPRPLRRRGPPAALTSPPLACALCSGSPPPVAADDIDWRVGSTTPDKKSGLALANRPRRTADARPKQGGGRGMG
jgi:hypothetical protein